MVCGASFINLRKSETLSEVMLANVEALADNESRDFKIQCDGEFIVCRSQYASFCQDLLRNCDVFTGRIEIIDCPDL